ncbi:MAG TPA: HAMP domain-containing histidine kinase [Caldithrix abyssi]|uniref:histidine kinase n=1 Tax=Caldithrix abyssi TaxID=187145 RepID=A0A7V4U0X3_CALAY|nr:HAMP domain-containing histidine kinase [Caldithrix abyssi]
MHSTGLRELNTRLIKYFFNITIRARIILIFGIFTLVLVAALARIAYVTGKDIYQAQLRDQVRQVCALLAADFKTDYFNYIQAATVSRAYRYIEKKLKKKQKEQELSNIFIFNSDYTRIYAAKAGIGTEQLKINRREIRSIQPGETAASLPFKGLDDRWYLWGFYRFNDDWYLGIRENARRLAKLDELTYTFLGIGFIGFVFVLLAAWLLSGALSRPIEKLVGFSKSIGQGQFYEQAPRDIHGELAVLAQALVRMQKSLHQKQKEKEEMLAQIAHEIRNPLGGIELLAGLLLEDNRLSEEQRSYIQKIQEEVQGLKTQITDYLQYSRPMPANPTEVNIADLLNEAEQTLRSSLQRKNIYLEKRINQSTLLFDRQHLLQIIVNLLSNSIDAVPEGGQIIIASEADGIYVQDNGRGIGIKNREDIFQPFFTTKKDGAGLGLAISRKLAEENDARLELVTDKAQRTIFKLQILT